VTPLRVNLDGGHELVFILPGYVTPRVYATGSIRVRLEPLAAWVKDCHAALVALGAKWRYTGSKWKEDWHVQWHGPVDVSIYPSPTHDRSWHDPRPTNGWRDDFTWTRMLAGHLVWVLGNGPDRSWVPRVRKALDRCIRNDT
jgi:hypothetical protein